MNNRSHVLRKKYLKRLTLKPLPLNLHETQDFLETYTRIHNKPELHTVGTFGTVDLLGDTSGSYTLVYQPSSKMDVNAWEIFREHITSIDSSIRVSMLSGKQARAFHVYTDQFQSTKTTYTKVGRGNLCVLSNVKEKSLSQLLQSLHMYTKGKNKNLMVFLGAVYKTVAISHKQLGKTRTSYKTMCSLLNVVERLPRTLLHMQEPMKTLVSTSAHVSQAHLDLLGRI